MYSFPATWTPDVDWLERKKRRIAETNSSRLDAYILDNSLKSESYLFTRRRIYAHKHKPNQSVDSFVPTFPISWPLASVLGVLVHAFSFLWSSSSSSSSYIIIIRRVICLLGSYFCFVVFFVLAWTIFLGFFSTFLNFLIWINWTISYLRLGWRWFVSSLFYTHSRRLFLSFLTLISFSFHSESRSDLVVVFNFWYNTATNNTQLHFYLHFRLVIVRWKRWRWWSGMVRFGAFFPFQKQKKTPTKASRLNVMSCHVVWFAVVRVVKLTVLFLNESGNSRAARPNNGAGNAEGVPVAVAVAASSRPIRQVTRTKIKREPAGIFLNA